MWLQFSVLTGTDTHLLFLNYFIILIAKFFQKISSRQVLFMVLACELINLGFCAIFFYKNHFLPAPFFVDMNDTFMDFYNPLYWVIKDGFYTTFNSVYPALNYFILKLFSFGIDPAIITSPFELRRLFPCLGWLNTGVYFLIILFVISVGKWKEINIVNKFWVFCICVLSAPILFGLERGNMIFWALPFLALYLGTSKSWAKAVFFGLLVNIKPYFGVFLIQYLNVNHFDKNQIAKEILMSVAVFVILGLLASLDFIGFFRSYIIFSRSSTISSEGVVAIPHSLAALSTIKAFINFGEGSKYTFWFSLFKVIGYLTTFILTIITLTKKLNKLELLIASFLIVTNFSVSTGGYILIIYIILLPLILNSSEYKNMIYPIFIIYIPIFDWIKLFDINNYERFSYLSGQIISQDINPWIGLGSIVRPIVNFCLMLFFIFHALNKYQPRVAESRGIKTAQ